MPRNRWVRWLAVGLAAGFVLVVVAVFYSRHATRQAGVERLQAVTARLDATDPRWQFQDVEADRGSLPDDQNSALLVPKFRAALVAKEFGPVRPGPTKSGVFEGVPPNRVLDDEGVAALDRALQGNDAALAIARSFKDYPRGQKRYAYTPDFIGTLIPDLQETRQVVAMLDAEAERLTRDGRPGAALELVRAMLNTGRSIDAEPFLVCCLVRIGCDSITVGRVERTLALSVPKGGLAELQAGLLAESEADLFWTGLRGERAGIDMLMTNLRAGRLPVGIVRAVAGGAGGPIPSLPDHARHWVQEPHLPGDHATYLETITQAREARRLPEHQQRAALRAVPTPAAGNGTELTRSLLPTLTKLHDAGLRAKAHLRCAAVGLAVERFRQTRGRWPVSLREVPGALLPADPLDPFDGQPLKYVQREDGVTIYSVGADEQDNGGTIVDGANPSGPGADIGFRLYTPNARAQPPLPRPRTLPEVEGGPGRGLEDLIDGGPGATLLPYPREAGDNQ